MRPNRMTFAIFVSFPLIVEMNYRSLLLLIVWGRFVFASPKGIAQTLARQVLVTLSPTPSSSQLSSGSFEELKKRQTTSQRSTCGYTNGDKTKPRTADSGFNCRVDTKNALWGFCPTSVVSAKDCGLVGNCIDANSCSNGCGIFGTPGITTFTWSVDPFPPHGPSQTGLECAG